MFGSSLFNNIELDNEIFLLTFSDEQKLVYLLNPASVRHVRVIGFYLKRSFEPGNYKTYKTCFIIPC